MRSGRLRSRTSRLRLLLTMVMPVWRHSNTWPGKIKRRDGTFRVHVKLKATRRPEEDLKAGARNELQEDYGLAEMCQQARVGHRLITE